MQSACRSRNAGESPTTCGEIVPHRSTVGTIPLPSRDAPAVRIVTIVLVAGVTLLLLPYVTGLSGAGVLYVVANPVMSRLDHGRHHKPIAFAIVFALFMIIVLPGAWVIAELVAQLPDAARSIQGSA